MILLNVDIVAFKTSFKSLFDALKRLFLLILVSTVCNRYCYEM